MKENVIAYNANYAAVQRHLLPDSPPDSSSEPSFSPINDQTNKINPLGHSLEEILMQPPTVIYANTQPLKHLPEHLITLGPSPAQTQTGQNVPVTMNPLPVSLPSIFGRQRKLSDSNLIPVSSDSMVGGILVKQEPGSLSPDANSEQSNEYNFDFNGESTLNFLDATYQCIRFQPFQQNTWHLLCDRNIKELPSVNYRVDADKGFNFSNADEAFVCQKKNHFQVTAHVQTIGEPYFVKTSEGLKKVDKFFLHFNGVKVESPSQTIRVEQSQSDRSKKAFHPVLIDCNSDQVTKVTIGRLHFSETTSNNMRKKGKPNPDQRYFYLVVSLHAHCGDSSFVVASHASERIIVRASNPGQFENDVELCWQKGQTPDSTFHAGRVGINTDRPEESLVVHGNMKLTGHIMQPSDIRAKQNVQEVGETNRVDTKEQLRNLQQLRIVRYHFIPDFARHVGLTPSEQLDTGVIAQEVREVIPDAVKEAGDIILPNGQHITNFLVVNKERIFMENVGAVKELCKVTDNLENRIDELERMNRKLAKLKRIDSLKSTSSNGTGISKSSSVVASAASNRRYRRKTSKFDSQSLCSNKFVQMTITILVVIMALCLVAMAILYILEWQNRNSSNAQSRNFVESHGSVESNSSHFQLNYSLPLSTVPSSTILEKSTSTRTPAIYPTYHQKPMAIGMPSHCLAPHHLCHTFCCDSKPTISLENNYKLDVDTNTVNLTSMTPLPYAVDIATLSQPPSQNIDIFEGSANANDVAPEHNSRYSDEHNSLGDIKSPIDPPHDEETEMRILKRETKRGQTKYRSDFINSHPSVFVPELNVTIGNEYCYYDTHCANGNFTYDIPISKFMPNQSLTLQFKFTSNTVGTVVDLCQIVTNKRGCYMPEATPLEERKDVEYASWLLPIGYFVESSYKFRIPNHGIRHQISCEAPISEAGIVFTEFNFLFHRICEDTGKYPILKPGTLPCGHIWNNVIHFKIMAAKFVVPANIEESNADSDQLGALTRFRSRKEKIEVAIARTDLVNVKQEEAAATAVKRQIPFTETELDVKKGYYNKQQTSKPETEVIVRQNEVPNEKKLAPKLLPKTNSILVNPRQRGNPILKFVRNVSYEYSDIIPDYVMGQTTCALYLSLQYHIRKPEYIYDRLKLLGQCYKLRVLLVQVDVKDSHHAIKKLTKIAILAKFTLMLAWSAEEAGRFLEIYKIFENKPQDAIMGKIETDPVAKLSDALSSVKPVNQTNAKTLLTTFKSFDRIVAASPEELSFCPGIRLNKAKKLHDVFNQPFLESKDIPSKNS
uniref:DNA excision repair protein ERCC-1 n=1 Tax=Strigamia maritima TaxID=126957 RepID=T1IU89_STRMM